MAKRWSSYVLAHEEAQVVAKILDRHYLDRQAIVSACVRAQPPLRAMERIQFVARKWYADHT